MGVSDTARDNGEDSKAWYYNKFLNRKFPDAFFDISKIPLEFDIKKLIKYCHALYLSDPLLSPAVNATVEYPITDRLYETKDPGLKRQWQDLLEDKLDIHDVLVRTGIDWVVKGNFFASYSASKKTFLRCPLCRKANGFDLVKKVSLVRDKFRGTCPVCKQKVTFETMEISMKGVRNNDRVIVWSPENMDIINNPITDHSIYTYNAPAEVRKDVLARPEFMADTPPLFLRALSSRKGIEFDRGVIHHGRTRYTSRGWGFPYILPALPIIFYIRVLRRAQQEIAFDFIFPMRVLFPSPQASMDPAQHIALSKWKSKVDCEVREWMKNPAHILKLPFPLGYESLGAEAKALNFHQEIEMASKQAVGALGIPIDLLMGPMNWSGASISLRKLETHFHNIRSYHQRTLDFVVDKASKAMGIPPIKVRLVELKLLDDLARKQFWFQLWQNRGISLDTLFDNLGIDSAAELPKILEEMKTRIKQDSELKKAAIEEEQMLQKWMTKEQQDVKMETLIQSIQAQLKRVPILQRQQMVEKMQTEMPELHKALYPNPEQLPPRRGVA